MKVGKVSMNNKEMNILVTIPPNNILYLKTMLLSLFENNNDVLINVFLLHSFISEKDIRDLNKFIMKYQNKLFVYKVDEETGNLLVNRASLLFTIIAGEPVVVNGVSYDDYNVGTVEEKKIVADSIYFGEEKVTAEESGESYTITVDEKNTKLNYKYEGWAETDKIYVITRDTETGAVTQNSLLVSESSGVYAYLTVWDAEVTEAGTKHMIKEGFVLSEGDELKCSYKFNLTVEFKGSTEV